MMSDKSSQQDRSTEVSERRKSKYYLRAAKKQSLEEEATKKHGSGILKSKQSSERRAKMYKETFPIFKSKMIQAYGEEFHYKGGSWHGVKSKHYRHYHIRKSMGFLSKNMNSSDDEYWIERAASVVSFFKRRHAEKFCIILLWIKSKLNSYGYVQVMKTVKFASMYYVAAILEKLA